MISLHVPAKKHPIYMARSAYIFARSFVLNGWQPCAIIPGALPTPANSKFCPSTSSVPRLLLGKGMWKGRPSGRREGRLMPKSWKRREATSATLLLAMRGEAGGDPFWKGTGFMVHSASSSDACNLATRSSLAAGRPKPLMPSEGHASPAKTCLAPPSTKTGQTQQGSTT